MDVNLLNSIEREVAGFFHTKYKNEYNTTIDYNEFKLR